MVEIELSMIPDAEIDVKTMTALVEEFEKIKGVKVHIQTMRWSTAWADLLTIASRGRGPDVSHIGGTWVSSLAILNVLRPFRLIEVQEMGGSKAFLPPTWQSTLLAEDSRVWSIPWTGYVYLICYRRDLLRKAGISDFNAAFKDHDAVIETIRKLCKSRVGIPWVMELVPPPYTDLVHTAASWIFATGGEYVDEKGRHVSFNQPEAIKGLEGWLELQRAVPAAHSRLSPIQTEYLFASGRAAAILTDNRSADTRIVLGGEPIVRENLGIASFTETPWCGGGSFVIWKYTQEERDRERAAVDLVKFLVSREPEVQWARGVHSLMARMEAIDDVYPDNHPLRIAVLQTAKTGRTHRVIPYWRRLEYQIANALNLIVQEARSDPSAEAASILHKHLDPLVDQLTLTLKG